MPPNRTNQPNQLKHKVISPQKALPYIIHFVLCPVVLKRTFFKGGEKVITNASAIIGKHGVVCSDVDVDDDTGRVIIDGIDWRAKSEGEKIPKGTRVVVTKIESVVLTVKKL